MFTNASHVYFHAVEFITATVLEYFEGVKDFEIRENSFSYHGSIIIGHHYHNFLTYNSADGQWFPTRPPALS